MKTLYAIAVAMLLLPSASVFAQSAGNTASATGSANSAVINPISITNNGTSLNFGSLVTSPVAGWASITYNSAPSLSYSNTGIDPGPSNRGPNAGENLHFTVTGETGFGWHFVSAPLQLNLYLNGDPSSASLLISMLYYNVPGYPDWGTGNQIPDPSEAPFSLPTAVGGGLSKADFWIGGTCAVPANAPTGSYNGTTTLTVGYE